MRPTGPETKFPLRLYERDEERFWAMRTKIVPRGKGKTRSGAVVKFADIFVTPYRVQRFCRTVIGFHTVGLIFFMTSITTTLTRSTHVQGDLDLQGRFKPRDKDLFVRWQGFREEVHCIKQHSAPKEVVLRLDDDTPVGSEPVTVTQYKVNSPRKLKAFLTNWRLEPCWFDLGTSF